MKKIIALLLFTTFGYSQTYTPVRSTLHDNIKLKTPPTITGETKALVRNSSTGQVSEQVIATASIPDASETVAGKVSVGTQTFGGNKTIVGESATVGNAFEVQNLAHTKILEVENKGRLIQRPVNRSNYVYSLCDIDGYLAFGLYLGGTGALTMEAYDASHVLYFQFSPTALSYFLPSFHVGDNVGETSAKLSVKSTTQGFLPPRMTTAQKNAIVTPRAGLMVFDTTLMKLCVFTTVWETITSI